MKIPPLFLKRWLPAAAWGVLILCASTGIASGEHTADFLQRIFAWFHFGSGHHPEHLGEVNFFARKSAHVLQFIIYALLVWRGCRLAPAMEARPDHLFDAWLRDGSRRCQRGHPSFLPDEVAAIFGCGS